MSEYNFCYLLVQYHSNIKRCFDRKLVGLLRLFFFIRLIQFHFTQKQNVLHKYYYCCLRLLFIVDVNYFVDC